MRASFDLTCHVSAAHLPLFDCAQFGVRSDPVAVASANVSISVVVHASGFRMSTWRFACDMQADDGLLDLLSHLLHDTPADFTYVYLADYV